MSAWVLSHLNYISLDFMPWWGWVAIGGAAAVAAITFIPAPPWNERIAFLAFLVCSLIGIKAWGYQQGFAFRDAQVEVQKAAEQKRLDTGFAKDATQEATAEASADKLTQALTKEHADVLQAIPSKTDASGNPLVAPIVIPADIAARLYAIGR